MIILFLIDTSASMNQRTQQGMSFLDCAKSAVEHFLKIRGRDTVIRSDRYFLVTCEEGPSAVKVGWNDSFAKFVEEVKSLKAQELSSLGPALKKSFDLLNQYRIQTPIENYGQGRIPWYIEPAVIILLTDGEALTTSNGVLNALTLPLTPLAGSELTAEPFRWDQRLFTIILKAPAAVSSMMANKDLTPPLSPNAAAMIGHHTSMAEVTGGKCQTAASMKALLQSIESIVPRIQRGVVINLEVLPISSTNGSSSGMTPLPEPSAPSTTTTNAGATGTDNSSHSDSVPDYMDENFHQQSDHILPLSKCLHKLMYVRSNAGHWPIPEGFLCDATTSILPPRKAQPTIQVRPVDADPFILKGFPYDEYELEPSALTAYLCHHKPKACWQTFIAGSRGSHNPDPFGFLRVKARKNAAPSVFLVVLPYNYPALWPLLDELMTQHKNSPPSAKWRQDFDRYLHNIPPYYIPLLRNALKRLGAPNVIPDHLDGGLNYTLSSYLEKLKQQSKLETEQIRAAAKQTKSGHQLLVKASTISPFDQASTARNKGGASLSVSNFHQLLSTGGSYKNPTEKDTPDQPFTFGDDTVDGISTAISGTTTAALPPGSTQWRNAFDIDRSILLQSVSRLRGLLLPSPLLETEAGGLAVPRPRDDGLQKHSVPIAQMGNYHEVLMRQQTLREIDEDERKKYNVFFGNPFVRSDKAGKMANMIDAIDVENLSSVPKQGVARSRPKKRPLDSRQLTVTGKPEGKDGEEANKHILIRAEQSSPEEGGEVEFGQTAISSSNVEGEKAPSATATTEEMGEWDEDTPTYSELALADATSTQDVAAAGEVLRKTGPAPQQQKPQHDQKDHERQQLGEATEPKEVEEGKGKRGDEAAEHIKEDTQDSLTVASATYDEHRRKRPRVSKYETVTTSSPLLTAEGEEAATQPPISRELSLILSLVGGEEGLSPLRTSEFHRNNLSQRLYIKQLLRRRHTDAAEVIRVVEGMKGDPRSKIAFIRGEIGQQAVRWKKVGWLKLFLQQAAISGLLTHAEESSANPS
ncbi:Integrator complex subunit 6 [Balamuthia mandrillaris]